MLRRTAMFLFALIIGAVALALWIGWAVLSVPRYAGPTSAHFDGRRFYNPGSGPQVKSGDDPDEKGFGAFLKWQFSGERAKWPDDVTVKPAAKPPARVDGGEIRVTFVGHSTFLIQMNGLNILTDPIWSKRCSPFSWAGPSRVRAPALSMDDLPGIDVVLVSHNHYDHLDEPTLRKLAEKGDPLILTGLGNASWLASVGVPGAQDMDWWDEHQVPAGAGKITFHYVPARHFSGRGLADRQGTLWGGFVVEGAAGRIYFAGDTGFGPHFATIRERLGAPDLSLIPIGAYEPRWFMSRAHVNPEEAVRAHLDLGSKQSLGMHFGTFQLTDEPIDAPAQDLAVALAKAGVSERDFRVPEFGGVYEFEFSISGELQ